jgi:hypothetical protein
MNKFSQILPFVQYLFDDDEMARKAAWIVEGILKGRFARLSDIAREIRGEEEANYKCRQRFMDRVDPKEVLLRLFQRSNSCRRHPGSCHPQRLSTQFDRRFSTKGAFPHPHVVHMIYNSLTSVASLRPWTA